MLATTFIKGVCLVGALTEQAFSAFHLDVAVLSAMGVHATSGTSESTLAQAAVKDAMARSATRVILAADTAKLQSLSRVRALPLERVDLLVTEADPDDAALAPFRGRVAAIV